MTNLKLLSHRGNISGKNPERENTVTYIDEALWYGFDVEIDVWVKKNKILLGHDMGIEEVSIDYLRDTRLLCHAKNRDALELMLSDSLIHTFWHEEDRYTISSKGIPIVYPDIPALKNSIVIIRGSRVIDIPNDCYGVCADNIQEYKDIFKKQDYKDVL